MKDFVNIDCMEYMKSMEDLSVDLTLTDIPYDGVNTADDSGGLRKLKKDNADIITFDLQKFLEEIYRVTKNTIIIFCGNGQVSEIFNYFVKKSLGGGTVRQLIWHKTNPSPMNGEFVYLSATENAVWFRKQGAPFNAKCKHNVFEFPTGSSEMHPTEKNHDLLRTLINDNSNEGDIIFDPCSGSGSTLYIANQMGRQFIGCEKDPTYYKKAKNRLDDETAQVNIFDYLGFNPYQE